LNNNRNNRRRGRGNRNQSGGGNQLNRIDSRARGNAPQLLDKYKKLAQDAQHNGDRVQAEYYLQFADHYFRVIADNKARQDEARGKRGDNRNDNQTDSSGDDYDYGDDQDDRRSSDNRSSDSRSNEGRSSENRKSKTRSRPRRDDDDASDTEGQEGYEGEVADQSNADASDGGEADDAERKPRRRRAAKDEPRPARTRKPRARKSDDEGPAEIDSSVLPPAIRGDTGSAGDDGDALEAVG
jgi:hypothetical protein